VSLDLKRTLQIIDVTILNYQNVHIRIYILCVFLLQTPKTTTLITYITINVHEKYSLIQGANKVTTFKLTL
jgi:hypothetical protein